MMLLSELVQTEIQSTYTTSVSPERSRILKDENYSTALLLAKLSVPGSKCQLYFNLVTLTLHNISAIVLTGGCSSTHSIVELYYF